MQTADSRLGLKCWLRPKFSHRLMPVILSVCDLYVGNKKVKSKPFNGKKPKSSNVLAEKFKNHLSNSQICALNQNTVRI